jgi:hypothetical protein
LKRRAEGGWARAVAPILASTVLLAAFWGCGSSRRRAVKAPAASAPSTTAAPATVPPPVDERDGPAFGLTEDDAELLWNPQQPARTPAAFQAAREQLTALHPTYLRLLVDWAALQPDAGRAPDLTAPNSGCAREVGPCGAYAGIAEELAAIASQQRADGGSGDFRVVLDVFGTPSWAARDPSGCELAGAAAFARPLRPMAIEGYRALIRSLLALGAREGVALEWWSPWNEPNDPRFVSPQRASCEPGTAPSSAAVYAQLARAMAAELAASGGAHHLVLGELNDLELDTPHSTSVARFIHALPRDVICLGRVWSIHAYARHAPATIAPDAVGALETALDARGACGRHARVWVTEAGAGASRPGRPRPAAPADEQAGCLALAEQLRRWHSDPRVGAVFQYTFREDPDFPVGLSSADLSHVYPTYRLWLAWSRLRAAGRPPPAPAVGCA